MKAATLSRFVRTECANFYESSCLFEKEGCKVLDGQRCSYFETAVLGPPDYRFRLEGYDYTKIFDQYGRVNPQFSGRGVVVRRCKCGEVLKPRFRLCPKCQRSRRREILRQSQRQRRLQQMSTVKL